MIKACILNLMPTKQATERHLTAALTRGGHSVDITWLKTATHKSKNTGDDVLAKYKTLQDIKDSKFDIFIITGAPVEHLAFGEVDYWAELEYVLEYTRKNSLFNIYICWAAQAALSKFYGIEKSPLSEKCFGIFEQSFNAASPFFSGFNGLFNMPHSRHTTLDIDTVRANPNLNLEAWFGEEVSIVSCKDGKNLFVTGHPEYEADTLHLEYTRDKAAGKEIAAPVNYYRDGIPVNTWQDGATQFYNNIIKHVLNLKEKQNENF
ncbi:homoserine O-succinyltransferase [Elusimicrobium simillimum]|uniref:homoserine O-acetyltransferase/O-succinyltransferase family protein n=1 Tax=Elusimicrobium simillimum TaxID=3143438 RepID=UPI003C6FE3DC